MAWELKMDRPIYLQLVEIIGRQVVSGLYPPGGKLPSVRELAEAASVNPNTMQRALAELERDGLIQTQRTNGRTVTEDEEMIGRFRLKLAGERAANFWQEMSALGYTADQAVELVRQAAGEAFQKRESPVEEEMNE